MVWNSSGGVKWSVCNEYSGVMVAVCCEKKERVAGGEMREL